MCKACQEIKCVKCGLWLEQCRFRPECRNHAFDHEQNVACIICRAASSAKYPARDGTHQTQSQEMRKCKGDCGDWKAASMFRKQKSKRSDICKMCERIPCRTCKVELPNESFERRTADHYWQEARHAVCIRCTDRGCSNLNPQLYKCTGPCGQEYGHKRFDRTQFKNHNRPSRDGQLVCNFCRAALAKQEQLDARKESKLTKLLAKSKRKGCNCGARLQHQEKCPMHPRSRNERPYRGMDVLSKEESDWLEARKRSKKNRL